MREQEKGTESAVDHFNRHGWVAIAGAKEDGRFTNHGVRFANRVVCESAQFSGSQTSGDKYGFFLIWNKSDFESFTTRGEEARINEAKSSLISEGGWIIKTGIVSFSRNGDGNLKTENALVAIKKIKPDAKPTPIFPEKEKVSA